MDCRKNISIEYQDQQVELEVESTLCSTLDDLWNKGKYPMQTQHMTVGYSIWSFVYSRSEIAQQELKKKIQQDCHVLIKPSAEAKRIAKEDEYDLQALEDNLNSSFSETSFLAITKDAIAQMQNYYEFFLFLPCVSVITDYLDEYKRWRSNMKPHTLDYTLDLLISRLYTKESLFNLFYDFCEGNILSNVFFVMKRHNENPAIFDNYYDGIVEFRSNNVIFKDVFDQIYGLFRKRHRGDDTDWDFSVEEESCNDKAESPDYQISGNGLAKYMSMISIQSWAKLYNLMAPCLGNDNAQITYFFPRSPQNQECWMKAYHGADLHDSSEKIEWLGSAYTLHTFISLLSPDEQPVEACWPVVAKYFCKKNNQNMWSTSTLQKATTHKGRTDDEPYVSRLKEIIKSIKN